MFSSIFSFEGRIRRLEYGLSYLAFSLLYGVMIVFWQSFQRFDILFYFYFAILYWFMISQGAKRCHDLGNNGFYQFIPFYGLFMLFKDGIPGSNVYGPNPKSLRDREGWSDQPSVPQPKRSLGSVLLTISSPLLLNLWVIALLLEYVETWPYFIIPAMLLTVIPCYWLVLVIQQRCSASGIIQENTLNQKTIYCVGIFLGARLYAYVFKDVGFIMQMVYLEILLVCLLIALVHLSAYLRIPGSLSQKSDWNEA